VIGISSRFTRAYRDPVAFRRLLERLGPTFVKLGQFLALRPDVIPQEYADELMRLLDRVEPFTWPEARAVLDADFGDWTRHFEDVDPRPVAAGSLAQVHRATARDGRRLALKILRPDIRRRVDADLRRARRIAHVIRLAQPDLVIDPHDVVDQLRGWLAEELDFESEASNIERLRQLAADDVSIAIPRVHRELCTPSVLTTDYLAGVPLTDILEAGDRTPLERLGFDARAFADRLVRSTLRQIFEYRFFHADVHPGNLLLLPGNVVGYVDFGLCQTIDQRVAREQARYLAAVYNYDVPRLFQALVELLVPAERADVEGLRADFERESARWRHPHGERDIGGWSPLAQWLIGIMRAARRNRFQVPPRLLAMYRTLLVTESTAHRLCAEVDLRTAGRDFLLDFQIRNAVGDITPERFSAQLLSLLELAAESPDRLNQMLSDLSDHRLGVHLVPVEDASERRRRDGYARMLVGGVACVAVAVWATQHPTTLGGVLPLIPVALVLVLLVRILLGWRSTR